MRANRLEISRGRTLCCVGLALAVGMALTSRAMAQAVCVGGSASARATVAFDTGWVVTNFVSYNTVAGCGASAGASRFETFGETQQGYPGQPPRSGTGITGGSASIFAFPSGGSVTASAAASVVNDLIALGYGQGGFDMTVWSGTSVSGSLSMRALERVRVVSSFLGSGSGSLGSYPMGGYANRNYSYFAVADSVISIGATAGAAAGSDHADIGQAQTAMMTVSVFPAPVRYGRLRALEVNQCVQDWNNSVPLIAGKPTFVRAFVEAVDILTVGETIKGVLRGWDSSGAEFPESPLPTVSAFGIGELDLDSNNEEARSILTQTQAYGIPLNFVLPPNWTVGILRLKVEGLNVDIQCAEPAEPGGVAGNCEVRAVFQPANASVRFFRVGFRDTSSGIYYQPSESDINSLAASMANYLPVAAIDYTIQEMEGNEVYLTSKARLNADLQYLWNWDQETNAAMSPYFFGIVGSTLSPPASSSSTAGLASSIPGNVACAEMYNLADGAEHAAHEFAHLLGRHHAVDHENGQDNEGDWKGYCGEFAGPAAPTFPYYYFDGGSGMIFPSIGPMNRVANEMVYGVSPTPTWNFLVYPPTNTTELMSYAQNCYPQLFRWTSKFTYEGMLASLQASGGFPSPSAAAAASSVLGPIAAGGGIQPASPGDTGHVLVRMMVNLATNTVEWLPFRCYHRSQPPPAPAPGPYTLEMVNELAQVVSSTSFALHRAEDSASPEAGFSWPMPVDASIRQARLKKNGIVIGTRDASSNAPTVQLLAPNGGGLLTNQTVTITWQATDTDADPVTINVSYSHNGGTNWSTLAIDLNTNQITVQRSSLKATTNGLFRISASDGFWCVEDCSDASFSVSNNPPQLTILAPDNGRGYSPDQAVCFRAAVYDPEQGSRNISNVIWSSDRNGPLGSGLSLSIRAADLDIGLHEIVAMATDSGGLSITVTNTIEIFPFEPPRLRVLGAPTNATIMLEVSGGLDTFVTLETSSNLFNWSPFGSLSLSNYYLRFPVPAPDAQRFYRAQAGPTPPTLPAFLIQPSDVTTTNGDLFALSAVSGGTYPMTYQWYFDGVKLTDATNEALPFPNSHAFQSGTYYAVASNAAGMTTSAVVSVTITGPDYQVIHWSGTNNLDGINGWGTLAVDTNGWLYGCTRSGGISNAGVIFKMRTNGQDFAVLRRLQSTNDGGTPLGGIIVGTDDKLYGTCSVGGTNNSGTIFRLNKDGTGFTVLRHLLSSGDCRNPYSELLEGSDGKLYGTAYNGGGFGRGGLFSMNKDGTGYQIIYGFKTTGNDGLGPIGGLIEAMDGLLYGTTEFGGQSNKGTIFRLAKAGTNYSKIKDLGLVAGGTEYPEGRLLQLNDGLLYGTGYSGGTSNLGTAFKIATDGSGIVALKSFGTFSKDGTEPRTGLTATSDGQLLGATRLGGVDSIGVIFKLNTNGVPGYQIVHAFSGLGGDAARSRSTLFRAADGVFYGSTFGGGTNDQGAIFRLVPP